MTAGGRLDVVVAHTSALGPTLLAEARSLLDTAFGDGFDDHDWDHALGGLHAVARLDGALVGHAAVVLRRLVHRESALRAGFVEAVGVRPDARRQGVASALMDALDPVIASYHLGALATSEAARRLYERRGWQQWRGPLFALTPVGVRRTADEDGGIYVLPVAVPLDLDAPLTCDWRNGDVW